jgi:CheY-like chemotaxis protein
MDSEQTSSSVGNEPPVSQHALAKNRLASHPEARPEVLEKLAEHGSDDLAKRVAENPNTTPATLDKLASHESAEVRIAVADNHSTTKETLRALAADENPDVRYRVAENMETSMTLLEALSEDENPYVVARAQDTLDAVQSVAERANDMMIKEHYADAETLYKKLIVGLEEYLGLAHPEVGKALHKLAAVLAAQHRIDEAQAVETRADAIKSSEGELS